MESLHKDQQCQGAKAEPVRASADMALGDLCLKDTGIEVQSGGFCINKGRRGELGARVETLPALRTLCFKAGSQYVAQVDLGFTNLLPCTIASSCTSFSQS